MTITDRHQYILQKLQETGKVDIQELSDEIRVSGVTIRKDLKMLEERNLLFRTRGGGSITNPYAVEKPINEKEFIRTEEKKKIAKAALAFASQTDSITIGSGTTVYELARSLYPARHLTVITPAIKVAWELYDRPNIEVLVLGGLIHKSSASAGGTFAEKMIADISCDVLFLGVDGIDFEFGLSITNIAEASLIQRMIQLARQVVILADSSKFGRRGLARISGIEHVDYIITDSEAPASHIEQLEEKGIKIIIAE